MPELSVIIPVYNCASYLRRCLDSLCAQTLQDMEFICVDDASQDDSRSILEEYAARDSRFRLLFMPSNGGVSAARNRGLELARGRWTGFLDGDDFVAPDFFGKLAAEGDASQADIVKGSILSYDCRSGATGTVEWFDVNAKLARHKAYFTAACFSAIYRSSFLRQHSIHFPEGVIYFEDSAFVMEAVYKAQNLRTVDEAVYYYVTSPESVTRRRPDDSILESMRRGSELTLTMLENAGADERHLTIICGYIFSILMMFCSNDYAPASVVSSASAQMAALLRRCPDSRQLLIDYFRAGREA